MSANIPAMIKLSVKLQKALDEHVPKGDQEAFVEQAVLAKLKTHMTSRSNQIEIYVDGGSRGNPGPSGGGFVIHPPDGASVQGSEFYGRKTNNQAEYLGLRSALREAFTLFPEANVKCFMDSELVVKQMRGEYRVKNEQLKAIYEEVVQIAQQFPSFEIGHVRREQNKLADKLANEAMDRGK